MTSVSLLFHAAHEKAALKLYHRMGEDEKGNTRFCNGECGEGGKFF
jgi:hypothetical protein